MEPKEDHQDFDDKELTPFQKRVKNLKREARRLVKRTGIPQHAALNKIAMREGFQTWAQFMAAKGETKGKSSG